MHLNPADRLAVMRILQIYIPGHEVWAFGSRVHGKNLKRHSDLDLAVLAAAPLPLDVLLRLRTAFSDSDLPFRVDVVDWAAADPAFRAIIQSSHEILMDSLPQQL